MFGKKCERCNGKISKEHNFCPHCGNNIKEHSSAESRKKEEREYGMLGKSDDMFGMGINRGFPLGSGGFFDIGKLIREFDKQFKELDRKLSQNNIEKKKMPTSGISISISASGDGEPKISFKRFGKEAEKAQKAEYNESRIEKQFAKKHLSDEKAKKISKLPREEAKTNVRRLSQKIVYEIELPGVNSLEDLFINRLENSIEIKAFSDKKAYFKLLPVNYPIADYKLKQGKLTIEFYNEQD